MGEEQLKLKLAFDADTREDGIYMQSRDKKARVEISREEDRYDPGFATSNTYTRPI